MKKRIVLCADDYGQALPISKAIIHLLENDRLTAVSCMTNSPHWSEHAPWLLPWRTKVDLGLHFNLTEGKALSALFIEQYGETFDSLASVISKAIFRRFNRLALEAELSAQIEAFITQTGIPPDFIDGHQHIHQFPQIRDVLLRVYRQRFPLHQPYIRLAAPSIAPADLLFNRKKLIIQLLGGANFKQKLNTSAIAHNASFSGIYYFEKAQYYADYFSHFLTESGDKGLIMCHPGLESLNSSDVIAGARYCEYNYLKSEQFIQASEKAGVLWERYASS